MIFQLMWLKYIYTSNEKKDLFYTNGDKTIILTSIGFYCKVKCITDLLYHTTSPSDLKVFKDTYKPPWPHTY